MHEKAIMFLTLLFGISLSGITALSAEASDLGPFEGKTVLHIGDSQVEGYYGVFLGAFILQHGAESYHRHGEGGKGVGWWLNRNRLVRDLIRYQPDIVLVTLGGNDSSRVAHPEYRESVERFYEIAGGMGARVIWVSPPTAVGQSHRLQRFRNAVCSVILEVVGESNFIDSREITAEIEGRAGDGIHFNVDGGREWARRTFPLLEQSLSQ
jgi:lysophospholipase L1-like esterase